MKDPNKIIVRQANGRVRVYTMNADASMTQQQFKDECDINNIMKKYNSTGEFGRLTSKQGVYADFSQITDYQEMLHTVKYAQDAFASLPAEVRKKFSNDPGELLAFVQDPNNYDEGVKLGLINERPIKNEPIKTNDLNDLNEGSKNEGKKTSKSSKNTSTNPSDS